MGGHHDGAEGTERRLGEIQPCTGHRDEGVVGAQREPAGRQVRDELRATVLDVALRERVSLHGRDRPAPGHERAQQREQPDQDRQHDGEGRSEPQELAKRHGIEGGGTRAASASARRERRAAARPRVGAVVSPRRGSYGGAVRLGPWGRRGRGCRGPRFRRRHSGFRRRHSGFRRRHSRFRRRGLRDVRRLRGRRVRGRRLRCRRGDGVQARGENSLDALPLRRTVRPHERRGGQAPLAVPRRERRAVDRTVFRSVREVNEVAVAHAQYTQTMS